MTLVTDEPVSLPSHRHTPGALVSERHEKGQPIFEYACQTEGCDATVTRNRQVASW